MRSSHLFTAALLFHLLLHRCSAYTPTTLILLDCGASSPSNDTSSRTWLADDRSKYAPPTTQSSSEAFPSSSPPVQTVPYRTARIFNSRFTYVFHLPVGPKFLRLHFFPDKYSAYDAERSFFSVTANDRTLLSNFSAYLNAPPEPGATPEFYREFVLNVEDENQPLNLTFAPAADDSFAFVNGIEIASVPDGLYFKGDGAAIKSFDGPFYVKNASALETLYRLNVGGADVQIRDDPGEMFRYWTRDDGYIFGADFGYIPNDEMARIEYTVGTPPYTAPDGVYRTSRVKANLSTGLEWHFPVDSGFYYMLRFHFCEIQREVQKPNERVFTISVDDRMLEYQTDVIRLTGGPRIPIYRDYAVFIPDDGRRGKKAMNLSLYPNLDGSPLYTNVLLNGLEMFKISDEKNSLAASNPDKSDAFSPPAAFPPKKDGKRRPPSAYAAVGGSIGAAAILAGLIAFLTVRRRRRRTEAKGGGTDKSSWVPLGTAVSSTYGSSTGTLPSDLCRRFSLDEITSATDGFDEAALIGRGGFGNVYRGLVDGQAVAIKRLNPSSNQGAHEFLTEIETLSKMRHVHLVSLIGYCNEHGEMILVYDYMPRGTLREHLYRSENAPMTWAQRLSVCIGAAKGLDYLHTGAKLTVIHRDVKSTNILLDEKFAAKVSDFGLSRSGPAGGDGTHVTTAVKGSPGYLDPEYYRRQQLTEKSDVYSFGVVLFEVLCGRPAIVGGVPREEVNLAEWAKLCHKKGTISEIVDPNLKGQVALECLSKFVETAVLCLRDKGIERPTMSDVVWNLEFAMKLQESAEVGKGETGLLTTFSPSHALLRSGESETVDEDGEIFTGSSENYGDRSKSSSSFLSASSSDRLASRDVFSEIKNPSGR